MQNLMDIKKFRIYIKKELKWKEQYNTRTELTILKKWYGALSRQTDTENMKDFLEMSQELSLLHEWFTETGMDKIQTKFIKSRNEQGWNYDDNQVERDIKSIAFYLEETLTMEKLYKAYPENSTVFYTEETQYNKSKGRVDYIVKFMGKPECEDDLYSNMTVEVSETLDLRTNKDGLIVSSAHAEEIVSWLSMDLYGKYAALNAKQQR